MKDELKSALFNIANRELERILCEASAKLMPLKSETLESIAKAYNDALTTPEATGLPKEARDKGKALVALLTAAAEFRNAAQAYAEAVIIQAAKAEP